MADLLEYKCRACGGALEFNTQIQKLKCPFCDSEYEVSEYRQDKTAGNEASETEEFEWQVKPGQSWEDGETAGMNVYSCRSCGGEIVCEETTASDSCPYCGSPVVMQESLSGVLKPDFIIPFKLDKQAAKKAFKDYVKSKKLVPKLFKDESHIDEIKGVYVPFWLFDASVEADITYSGEKTRSWSDSEYNYVEHNHYNIYRSGTVAFDHVPVDGSEKMPDDMMESIEPFDMSEAADFNPGYLVGYMADKYDVDAQQSIEAANARIKRSTEESFGETIRGFDIVTAKSSTLRLKNGSARYALYPVWLLNTGWQNKTYTFAMNGQTGKFVGDLPLDKSAYRKKFCVLAGVLTVIGSIAAIAVDYIFI